MEQTGQNQTGRSWDLREAICRVSLDQPESLSDEALMMMLSGEAGRKMDDALFNELHRRFHPRVLRWCRKLTRKREDANDLAQEVFLRAFRYIHTFRGDSSVSTWLYVVTRNHCMNSLKKGRRDPVENAGMVSPAIASSDGNETYKTLAAHESFENMWNLINANLTPLEARVMALHYGHELPLVLITRELGLTNPSGAKAYIVNGRRKLNNVLRGRRRAPRVAAGMPLAA